MISTLIDNRPDRKFTETRTSYIPGHVNVGAGIITRTNEMGFCPACGWSGKKVFQCITWLRSQFLSEIFPGSTAQKL